MKNRLFAILAVLALMGVLAAFVFEFQWLANTFNAGGLVAKSVAAGLAAGAALYFFFFRKKAADSEERLQAGAACLLLCAAFAPLAGSLSNRLLSPHPAEARAFEFFEEKPFASSRFGFVKGEKIEPTGWFLFVFKDGKLERLRSKSRRFEGVQRGETVSLEVKRGLWGFEVVQPN